MTFFSRTTKYEKEFLKEKYFQAHLELDKDISASTVEISLNITEKQGRKEIHFDGGHSSRNKTKLGDEADGNKEKTWHRTTVTLEAEGMAKRFRNV